MAHDVFICYATHDKAVADAVCANLEENKVRCWYAPRDIAPGEDWQNSITTAIQESKVFLLIFSHETNRSTRMLHELEFAITHNIIILPLRFDNILPEGALQYYLSTCHWIDAVDASWQESLSHRVRSLISRDNDVISSPMAAPMMRSKPNPFSFLKDIQRNKKRLHSAKSKRQKKPSQPHVKPPKMSAPLKPSPSVPFSQIDTVHFSITSPPVVKPASSFIANVWAHLDSQRQEVIERAREAALDDKLLIKSKGPIEIARGTILTVQLRIQDCAVEPAEDTILWKGEIGNADFSVRVNEDAALGSKQGVTNIYANGLKIAHVFFNIRVGAEATLPEKLGQEQQSNRTAFASYSSEDEDKVLVRLQGLCKALPDLDIFFPHKDISSGEDWQQRLATEIDTRDILYLFWSQAASRSKWVEWEWKHALQMRGIGFINPFPLVPSSVAPPPSELAEKLHFDDWQLSYMRASSFKE